MSERVIKLTSSRSYSSKSIPKTTVGVYLSKNLVRKTRKLNLNLSKLFETTLKSTIDYLEASNTQITLENKGDDKNCRFFWSRGWELNPFIAALQAAA